MSILANSAALRDALAMNDLPPEQQEELLLEVTAAVFEGVVLRMTEQMDDATRTKFEELLATEPSDEQVEAFVREHVPNADELVAETIADMRNDILRVTGSGSE